MVKPVDLRAGGRRPTSPAASHLGAARQPGSVAAGAATSRLGQPGSAPPNQREALFLQGGAGFNLIVLVALVAYETVLLASGGERWASCCLGCGSSGWTGHR